MGGSDPIKIGTPFIIGSIEVSGTVYPVYRKIVDCGTLPNATTKRVAHGITYNDVLNLFGTAKNSTVVLPLPNLHEQTASFIVLFIDGADIVIRTGSDRSSYNGLVTIDYY